MAYLRDGGPSRWRTVRDGRRFAMADASRWRDESAPCCVRLSAMAGPAPVELLADCTHCRLESGLVETYDVLVAACRFGLPATARCKLCGAEEEGRLDRPTAKPLADIPANLCPGCLGPLDPGALDDAYCRSCGARASRVA